MRFLNAQLASSPFISRQIRQELNGSGNDTASSQGGLGARGGAHRQPGVHVHRADKTSNTLGETK